MKVEFVNKCTKNVILSYGNNRILIPKKSNMTVDFGCILDFSLRCEDDSCFLKGTYNLILETFYNLSSIKSAKIFISRERILVGLNVKYERILVSSENQLIEGKNFKVCNEEKMRKIFRRKEMTNFLFLDILEYFTELVIILSIISVVLFFVYGWKVFIVFTISYYLLLLSLNFIHEFIIKSFFKKSFRMKSKKEKYDSFFVKDNINDYVNSFESSFWGDYEFDG